MTGPDDRDAAGLRRLLDDLAGDPAAPPSSVSGLSVIAAAKAAAADPAAAPGGGPAVGAATGSAGATHLQALHEDADRRARRRRTVLLGGLVAACVVALVAVVVPIVVSTSSSTTSAGSAADQPAAREGAGAAATTAAGSGADAAGTADQEQAGAGTAPTIDPSNPDANRPPPGESALSQALPVPGVTNAPDGAGSEGAAAGSGAAAGCWPVLPDPASEALVAALPAGAFGAPEPLGLGCPADPVGGAQLAGTTPDTQVVVRVTRAEPGACAAAASETGSRCVAQSGDRYVANIDGNLSVFAYGNGFEVEVGGRPATGIAPIPSGLTADQLSQAAAAVLSALG